jgi:hypothetical protein
MDAPGAALLYLALTVGLTWPLVRGLTRDLPADLGDPLFVTWVLAWDATHLGRGLWNANIFFPHPLALAYSEHFLTQAVQILPVYALTKNPVLCYNLLFLSTFVLSGVAMFMLVRELTGSRAGGLVAGLAYAFAPYRFSNLPHLQVLSSAWMALVFLGLRRFFETGRIRPLAAAGAAWLAQNLSCGYYLFFFSPAVAAYMVWEITTRRRWSDRQMVLRAALMAMAVALSTVPFLLPYLQLRQTGIPARPLEETIRFSADVHAYFTAASELWIDGRWMQDWPRSEGLLFPGFTITALAAAAVALPSFARHQEPLHTMERIAVWGLLVIGAIVVLLTAGWPLRLPGLKITSFARAGWTGFALACGLLVFSRRVRCRLAAWFATPPAFFVVLTIAAIDLSFGPEIRAHGRTVANWNPYALLYTYVPGFNGLRAAARFGMLVAFALAVLVGFASARLAASRWRFATWVAGALIVLEACSMPLPTNYSSADYLQPGLAPLPATLETEASRTLYAAVAGLPDTAAIVELPLGEPAFDIRYMFYSTRHWKRLVNGYSGGQPVDYGLLDQSLRDVTTRPGQAWQALRNTRATHAIVHEAFYADRRGGQISDWLRRNGAKESGSFGTDRIFELPPAK